MTALLQVEGLSVRFCGEAGDLAAVSGVGFTLRPGETLGLVGRSGSGKSVTAYAILRLLPRDGGRIAAGTVLWRGTGEVIDLARLPPHRLPDFRGREIAMVFQEPMTSLNPVLRCGAQVAEAVRLRQRVSRREARRRAVELLAEVGIPRAAERASQYPHELSGGMKQRVMIAMALALEPKLLVCDEPTTALDVTTQKKILRLIRRESAKRGMAVLFITHDLAVVAEIADRVAVMCPGEDGAGRIVEEGPVREIFARPRHPYTRGLLACRPTLRTRTVRLPTVEDHLRAAREGVRVEIPLRPPAPLPPEGTDPLLAVRNLRVSFRLGAGFLTPVDGVDLDIARGRTLGLVGESGCGKTTLARAILRLVDARPGSSIRFGNRELTTLSRSAVREVRRRMQIVFQDPASSLDPRQAVAEVLAEPLSIHGLGRNRAERRERAAELLRRGDLSPDLLDRRPHELSGGERQRVCIARALATEPEFLVLDEAVSSLDVSVQASVLNLLLDLRERLRLTCLFVSHDLAVVKYFSDEVAVMASDRVMAEAVGGEERERLLRRGRGGRIVERRPAEEIYADPRHPYTRSLLASLPRHAR